MSLLKITPSYHFAIGSWTLVVLLALALAGCSDEESQNSSQTEPNASENDENQTNNGGGVNSNSSENGTVVCACGPGTVEDNDKCVLDDSNGTDPNGDGSSCDILGCGSGTVQEGDFCVPAEDEEPEVAGPCELELIDDVDGQELVTGFFTNQPALIWTGDHFLAFYVYSQDSASTWTITSRVIQPDGQVEPEVTLYTDEGLNGAQLYPALNGDRVALAVNRTAMDEDNLLFILDDEGELLAGPTEYSGIPRNTLAVEDEFLLHFREGWKSIALDATLGPMVSPVDADVAGEGERVVGMSWSEESDLAVLRFDMDDGYLRLHHFDIDGSELDGPQIVNTEGRGSVSGELFDTGDHYIVLSPINAAGNIGTVAFRLPHDLSTTGIGSAVRVGGTAMGQFVWTGRFFYYSAGRYYVDALGETWTNSIDYPRRAPEELGNGYITQGIAAMDETTLGILQVKEADFPNDVLQLVMASCEEP